MKRIHIIFIAFIIMLYIYPAAAQDTMLLPGTDVSDRYLRCYSGFYDGRTIVFDYDTNSRYCIDTDGKIVFVIPDDMGIGSNYVNGLLFAVIDDTMVMLDRNGRTVIAPDIQGF